jgi:asparagine synthase (glutamine-hydrolysing)
VVCRTADFELFPEAIWHSEDPALTCHEIPMLLLARATAERVKVVLTGEGSDELFGGYPWFKADRLLRPLARLPLPLRRLASAAPGSSRRWPGASRILLAPGQMNLRRYQHLIAPLQSDLPGRLFSPDLEQMLRRDGLDEPPRPIALDRSHPFTQLQHYEMNVRLPDWIVRQLDRSSMAYSLEARVPFLDHELVELCARIPARLKARGPHDKPILRQALASVLPPEILRRRKRGMTVPVEQWFRSPLPDFATALLARESLADKGYFSPGGVVQMLEQHRAGRGRYGHYLLGVLGVQLWDELFVRGCRPSSGA